MRAFSVGPVAWLWRNIWRQIERLGAGGEKYCICCGNRIFRFLPFAGGWKTAPPVVEHLRIVGSDLENFECPRCGASDRERHLVLYCEKFGLLGKMKNTAILHFAPEKNFSRYVQSAPPSIYVCADLCPQDQTVAKMNLQCIPHPDQSFNVVIVNHVLEHVENLEAALFEIHRVLKPGGFAILQTPYSNVLHHTFEDPGITTAAQREFLYAQIDHVRVFGRDIFEKFTSSGLLSRVVHHEDVLQDVDVEKYGVNHAEPLFLFERVV